MALHTPHVETRRRLCIGALCNDGGVGAIYVLLRSRFM